MVSKMEEDKPYLTDAYDCGLDRKQAAWAAQKYRGRWVLPHNIIEELWKKGLVETA